MFLQEINDGTWWSKVARKKTIKLISTARSEAVCSVARTFWLLMQSSEAAAARRHARTAVVFTAAVSYSSTVYHNGRFGNFCPKRIEDKSQFQELTFNFGNFQFWQLSILAPFNFSNFQFHSSKLLIYGKKYINHFQLVTFKYDYFHSW